MIETAVGLLVGGSTARAAATLLAGIVIGAWGAWTVQTWRHGHLQAKQIERNARDLVRQVEHRDRTVVAYTEDQADADEAHRSIAAQADAIARRPEYAGQCLDDDGLRELRAAIRGTAGGAGGAGPAMPATR